MTRENKGRVFAHIHRGTAQWTVLCWWKQMGASDHITATQNYVFVLGKERGRKRVVGRNLSINCLYVLPQFQPNYIGCSLLIIVLRMTTREKRTVSHENMKATITPGSWMIPKHMYSFMEQLVLTWLDDNLVWNDPVKFSHWGRSCSHISHAVPLLSPPPQGSGWLEAHLYHVHHSLQ